MNPTRSGAIITVPLGIPDVAVVMNPALKAHNRVNRGTLNQVTHWRFGEKRQQWQCLLLSSWTAADGPRARRGDIRRV